MASHKEASCSVKKLRVHTENCFFPLCCLLSSSSNKDKSFETKKVGLLGFILLLFSLLGTVLAKEEIYCTEAATEGY